MAREYPGRSRKSRKRNSPGTNAVIVDGYSQRWLDQGFCWVYPKEVLHQPPKCRPGTTVQIRSEDGRDLGAGIWDDGWIAVRRFRSDHGAVDKKLLAQRLDKAIALRRDLLDEETTAFRWVNAENDGLPGIRIDAYAHFLVISLDSPSLSGLLVPICDLLEDRLEPRAIFQAWRPDPRDKLDTRKLEERLLRGHAPPGDVRVIERSIACLVRPGAGKDIGIFPDMRDNRAWLEPHWNGRRVLNLFGYTGFFSVVAASHGASETVTVDLSSNFLDRAEANFQANGIDPANHLFMAGDVRKVLDRLRRTGEVFDIVVLDPPSFSHGPEGPMSLKKALPGLVSSSTRVLRDGGWLVASTNLGELSPKDFHALIRTGARKSGCTLQLLHEGGQASDFPSDTNFPEGRYLKFGVWRVSHNKSSSS